MSEIHYFICDQCAHHEAVAKTTSVSWGSHYSGPMNWTTVGHYEVCSIECAKNKAEKLNGVPAKTTHCTCKGCR